MAMAVAEVGGFRVVGWVLDCWAAGLFVLPGSWAAGVKGCLGRCTCARC